MMEPVQPIVTKPCPICSEDLPLTEYGVCRARKDGRNLYCKSCIRKKVSESRRAFKAYKSVRHQYVSEKIDTGVNEEATGVSTARRQYVVRQVSKMTPAERVREAIKNGARTQKEIAQGTKLGKDEIGDALANLLLWTREIRTEVIDNNRVYLINQPSPELLYRQERPAPNRESQTLPSRKRDVPSSFSAVQDLMPGKKSEGEPERAPGWVAA
ncbi:MAG: hypothetical protein JWM21_4666 [Acidobacteria bacterium]|nr:hypothetical protein [Acidobacteriota bacterium]